MQVVKMLEYSQYLRHSYFDTLCKLSWDELVKDRGASFDSLRDIFLHCVEVLDRYVNHRCRGKAEPPRIKFEDYDRIEKIKDYFDRVESDSNRYLETVNPEELSKKVLRKFKDGGAVEVTVEDILFDFFQEETLHRGEFIALLWQMNIEPPHLGWTKYLSS